MRLLTGLFLVALMLVAGGCAAAGGLDEPQARVLDVAVAERTDHGARVEIVIELLNPNAVPLPLLETDYSVRIDGFDSFVASAQPNRTLPGRVEEPQQPPTPGRQLLRLAAAFATDGRDLRGAAYRVSGTVTYEPPGEMRKLLTDSGVPLPVVIFSASGTLE